MAALITECSSSLDLLAQDIQRYRLDLNAGQRIIFALLGVLLTLPAFILSSFGMLLAIAGEPRFLESGLSAYSMAFSDAFECFRDEWTGKLEPEELKKLSDDLKMLHKQSLLTSRNRHAFHTAVDRNPTSLIQSNPNVPVFAV